MARVTNSYQTYDATTNREDLSNIIYNIDPADTPLFSALGRRDAKNRFFEWSTDTLPAVNVGNAQVEGLIFAGAVSAPPARLHNVCQISTRDATVTGSQEASNPAGKKSEMGYQMALKSKALKRDMESIASQTQAYNAGSGVTGSEVARTTRALEHWLSNNVSVANTMGGTGYAAPGSETAAITDGTQRAFTETLLKAAMVLAYNRGAEPSLLVCGPGQKGVVSGFAGRTTARQIIGEKEIVATASMYASDFGDLRVVPSRWMRNRSVFLLDPEYAAIAYFRPFFKKPMPIAGDAEANLLIAEWGVEMRNPNAHQLIADLS
jgi:hypothetical protein